MKKGEKIQRGREYKSELVANIKAAGTIEQPDFKRLVETLDKKYSVKEDKTKNIHNIILYELKKKGIVETVKVNNTTLISLKDNNSINKEEAKEIVKSVVPQNSERKRVVSKKLPFNKESISLEERVLNVIRDPRTEFTYSELAQVMKLGFYISTQYLIGVNKSCVKKYGKPFGDIDAVKRIFTKNPELSIIDEIKKIQDTVDEPMEVNPIGEESDKVVNDEGIVDFETAYIRFAVAGILKSLRSMVKVNKLTDQLKEYFGIEVDPRLLLVILKEDHEFTLINGGEMIGLRSDNSWDILKTKYSPKNYTVSILARINMTPEEVRSYFDNAEITVVSAIQKADNIYELVIDRSVHTRRQLLKLVKSFRGTDKILDKDMEERVLNYLIEEEDRSYKFYCPLEIEDM